MPWVMLDDGIFHNRKIIELPPNSKLLLIGSLCYCSDQMTDGYLSAGAAKATAGLVGVPWTAHKALLAGGLWHETPGGFEIHDYLDYQRSAEQLRATKEAEADRKRRWRAANANRQEGAEKIRNNGRVTPSVPPGQPTGRTPSVTPSVQESVPPSVRSPGTGRPLTQVVKASLLTNAGSGERLRDEKQDNPKSQKLIARFLSIADQRPGAQIRLRSEAERWMPHLLDHVAYDALDECIGKCEADATDPPNTIAYLVQTVRSHVRSAGMSIPDLPYRDHPVFER